MYTRATFETIQILHRVWQISKLNLQHYDSSRNTIRSQEQVVFWLKAEIQYAKPTRQVQHDSIEFERIHNVRIHFTSSKKLLIYPTFLADKAGYKP